MSFYIPTYNDHLIIEDFSSILPCVCPSIEFVAMQPTTLFNSENGIVV